MLYACAQEFTTISPFFSYPPHNYQALLRSKERLSVVSPCFLIKPGGLVRGMMDSYEPARNVGVTLLTSQLAVWRNSNSAQLLCASNLYSGGFRKRGLAIGARSASGNFGVATPTFGT